MRIILILLFLAFPVMGCYCQPPSLQEKTEGTNPYSWDFGRVKEDVVLKHSFTLKNESDKILTIKDVNTSCGCTASGAQKKRLKPKESTSLDVQFKSKGYSGPVKQYIYVHTDNVDNPVIRFIIKAEVVKKKTD